MPSSLGAKVVTGTESAVLALLFFGGAVVVSSSLRILLPVSDRAAAVAVAAEPGAAAQPGGASQPGLAARAQPVGAGAPSAAPHVALAGQPSARASAQEARSAAGPARILAHLISTGIVPAGYTMTQLRALAARVGGLDGAVRVLTQAHAAGLASGQALAGGRGRAWGPVTRVVAVAAPATGSGTVIGSGTGHGGGFQPLGGRPAH